VRLLFDEHLSPKLVRRLDDLFPDSRHVQHLGLRGRKDRALWGIAREEKLVIVSRDSDFEHLSMSLGAPPQVILVRTRDGHTTVIESMFRQRFEAILQFERTAGASLLVLEQS
jgi:predicted nuclease of predicted toxin-antitoxin system